MSRETCEYPEGHDSHMAVGGECPWCGEVDTSNALGTYDVASGTVLDRYGNVIEHGNSCACQECTGCTSARHNRNLVTLNECVACGRRI